MGERNDGLQGLWAYAGRGQIATAVTLGEDMGKAITEEELALERHRCEVRTLIRVAREYGRGKVRAYLDHKAVKSRAPRLRADLNAQIERGNNGEHGVWL